MADKEKILMLVESPVKVKTIKQFLPSNYTVMASVGHITEIANSGIYNMGIDPTDGFKADYRVSEDKKDVVKKLSAAAAKADKVVIASDPDREGELIAYSLKKFLKIPDSKYERVTFHEITKKAVLEALAHPRHIDEAMAVSAMTRARLDKIVGFRLSPLAMRKIGARSVGRCQSAGLKVIVDKEKSIRDFVPESYCDLFLRFSKDGGEYKAKYSGFSGKKVDSLKSLADAQKVMARCAGNPYEISGVEAKEALTFPKPPFTTSTFQQEVSSKLGISVKAAMQCAQKLFEGIELGGRHVALITYLRTDSSEFAPEFADLLSSYVKESYGPEYFMKPKAQKKGENVQDGHEAIRVVDLGMTPAELGRHLAEPRLLSVYTIIYKRTVASYMAPTKTAVTNYEVRNGEDEFSFASKEMVFDGFKKVYSYAEDDEKSASTVSFEKCERLKGTELEPIEKTTQPPKRYSESSFIKTLDKLGVGRPSTYATIVSTLLDERRGYCVSKDKALTPTEKGLALSEFLNKSFGDIISTKYTAEMEKDLDKIADGKMSDIDFLGGFYSNLEKKIDKIAPGGGKAAEAVAGRVCPECGKPLILRHGKYGDFIACTGYPKCRHTEKCTK